MHFFCRFLGILILSYQSNGEDLIDCTNSLDRSNNQNYCKQLPDLKDSRSEATSGHQSNLQEYVCQDEGRFPDLSDSTCMRYFQCERTNNGTLIKKSLKCPNSTFCGITQKCSSLYPCPCDATTIIEIQTSSESYNITEKTTEDPCSVSTVTDFECSSVGRFPDLDDPTCQTYFLCSHLYNGSFIKTKYKCLKSFFNPVIKRCSANFTCPCTITTTATSPVTGTTSSQYITSTVVYTSPSPPSSSHTASENVTISSGMTSDRLSTKYECTIATSKDYECVKAGRFPDFSDITCRKYFLCSKLQNGTFIKTPYECKQSYFNPATLRCSTSYICPCTGSQTTLGTTPVSSDFTSPLTTSSLSTHEESKPTVVTKPLPVTSTVEPSGITTISSEATTVSTPISITPSVNTSVTTSLSSSSEIPICNISVDDFICISKGRYPDLSDITCKTYFLCSHLFNGSFVKTKYRCPNSARFYPPSQECSTEYICPCTTAATTAYTVLFTTTDPLTVSPVENVTIMTSFESSTNLTSPVTDITTSPNANYTSSTVGCTVSSTDFQCTISGRFPDFSDITCRNYFLCSQLSNGTFIKTRYTCPSSTFNPLILRCSDNYVCPCDAESTVVTFPIDFTYTSEGFTKLSSTTIIPSVTTTTPVEITTSYSCIPPTGDIPEFTCSAVGRYPDYFDVTCRRYFLCSKLHNGTFIKTPYTCPKSTCINTEHRCSSICKCPCLL